MNPSPESILAELKVKRDLRSVLDSSYRDYFRTYATIILYLAWLMTTEFALRVQPSALFTLIMASFAVCAAITDTQAAAKRRWTVLVALLEEKGVL
jgi:di/tricarboxylate transporter